jgi:hexulose-6-phosphate isomerase
MIKGISQWSFAGGLDGSRAVSQILAEAKSAGFAAVELAVAQSGQLTPSSDAATIAGYRREADRLGIQIQTLASGMSWECSPTHDDPGVRRKGIDLHKSALRVARDLGCASMLFVPGAVRIPWDEGYGPVRYDHAIDRARIAVAELGTEAQKMGVELCVENVWNGMFYSPVELCDFVDSFQNDKVGIYFDVGNVLGYHQHAPHWIEILGKRIKRVHIKDFKRSIGTLNGFCDLLAGDVPLKESIAALRKIGYDKTVVAEMIPWKEGLLEQTSTAMDEIFA